jgi:hypothetical protein
MHDGQCFEGLATVSVGQLVTFGRVTVAVVAQLFQDDQVVTGQVAVGTPLFGAWKDIDELIFKNVLNYSRRIFGKSKMKF